MIRPMTEADRPALLEMMRTFYESPAVSTNGSAEIFNRNIDTCLADGPYLKGYVLELDGEAKGYALLAISHASEFGCPCVWIEDLYVTEGCRSQGLGREFLTFVRRSFPDALLRLEVEEENQGAIKLYKKCGFSFWPYEEMKNEPLT